MNIRKELSRQKRSALTDLLITMGSQERLGWLVSIADRFTIPELRHVYSIVLDKEMDPGNFRRKFNRMLEDGLIEQAPGKRITASKPATVYRFKRR